jgi:hypothetical protein
MGQQPITRNLSPVTRADGALVIFAKAPVPGQVKTRLCPPLTPDEAATLHGSFVLDMLERTKLAVRQFRLPLDRILACAPDSKQVFFKIMEERHGVSLIDQAGEDLGARMHRAFTEMFVRDYRQVLIIGTDAPSLPLAYYQQAVVALKDHELVLGPAQDGGYYLIGLTRTVPELFSEIPWSTDQVLIQTRGKAERLRLKTAYLPPWRDIDTIQDLQALIEESRQDMKQPKQQRVFTTRTAGALDLIAKRLKTRHG